MKIKELLDILQDAMNELRKKDVRQKSAATLIQETSATLSVIAPPLSVDKNRLWYDTALFGKLPIAEFKVHYGHDKRTIDGFSYQIEQVDVILMRELPEDLELSGLGRLLHYQAALNKRQEALENITKLEAQIAAEKKIISDMLVIIEQGTKE